MIKLSREVLEELLDDEKCTVARAREIRNAIEGRISYIVNNLTGSHLWQWPDESFADGFHSDLSYCSVITRSRPDPYDCHFWLPTRWFWEDYQQEMKDEIQKWTDKKIKAIEVAKAKRVAFKENKAKMKKTILEKLTKEELKFIKFK